MAGRASPGPPSSSDGSGSGPGPKLKPKLLNPDEPYRFGVVRRSMRNNPLLEKAQLGKRRTRCASASVIRPGMTFGAVTEKRDGGTAECVGEWKQVQIRGRGQGHRPSTAPVVVRGPDGRPQKSFLALNKRAVSQGLVTAKEQRLLHQKSPVYLKESSRRRLVLHRGPHKLPPAEHTYGVPSEQSINVSELVGNQFARDWASKQMAREERARRAEFERTNVEFGGLTRTSVLRAKVPEIDPPPLWRMPKFKKTPARLVTFRSREAYERAMSEHVLESACRRGTYGSGTIKPGLLGEIAGGTHSSIGPLNRKLGHTM